MKMKCDKETNILKKNQTEKVLEMKVSLSQIKCSMDNLTNRMVHRKREHQDLETRYRSWYIQLKTTTNLHTKRIHKNLGCHEKIKSINYGHRRRIVSCKRHRKCFQYNQQKIA